MRAVAAPMYIRLSQTKFPSEGASGKDSAEHSVLSLNPKGNQAMLTGNRPGRAANTQLKRRFQEPTLTSSPHCCFHQSLPSSVCTSPTFQHPCCRSITFKPPWWERSEDLDAARSRRECMKKAGVASLSTIQEKDNVSHTWYLKLGEGDFK